MLDSINRIEEVYCEKLSVGNRGLVGVLDLAVDDFDSDEVMSKSDQELSELTGMSERSARRLKKIVQIYNEQNWNSIESTFRRSILLRCSILVMTYS